MPLKKAGGAGLIRAFRRQTGGRWSSLCVGGLHRCRAFGYFSAMVNNLPEFKPTVAWGGTVEEIKTPRTNDGNCRGRQEVIDK